jgi:hypothetical protein
MDDLAAELADLLQRRIHVRDGEIRERHSITRARSAGVEAERGTIPVGLPAFPFIRLAPCEIHAQEPAPEPSSPGRIIGGELHEPDR